MLQGMQRLDKKNYSCKLITSDILQKIIPILHMVCSSNYETHLLSAAFFVVRTMKPICCMQHFYLPFLVF